jgi:hypothetical protein
VAAEAEKTKNGKVGALPAHGPTYQMQFELFADTTPKEIQLKLFNAIGNTPKGEEKEKRTK